MTLYGNPEPLNANGNLDISFVSVPGTGLDVEITPVTRNNSFRTGQQLLLYLGVELITADDGNFITQLQLKPWWARQAQESRQAFGGNGLPAGDPGDDQQIALDTVVFGDGPLGNRLANNRYVWMPSQKYINVTEFQTPPPDPAPARNCFSLLVDDVWVIDLPDPATVASNYGASQTPAIWKVFEYPAYGWALGFTGVAVLDDPAGDAISPRISLNWQQLATKTPLRPPSVTLP